jgi:hypothetical protein
MTKYLISIATELDGHSGSTSCYLQTDGPISRQGFLAQLSNMFGTTNANEDISFEEYPFSVERNASGQYNGEMVFTSKKDSYTVRMPVAILATVLPSRMTKNRMYIIESRTG